MRYLISKGADVNIQDECGRTPLFIASGLRNWDVVETIVAACCIVDTRFVVWNFVTANRSPLALCHELCWLLQHINLERPVFANVNTCRKTPLEIYFTYVGNKKIYCIFRTWCIISVLYSSKCHLFHNVTFFCWNHVYALKFKYQLQ